MNVAFVYFTFSKDNDLLLQSIRGLRLLGKKHNIDIHIVNDALSPISTIPDGCFYHETSQDRGQNMIGNKWVLAEYNILDDIQKSKDYDWVVKIDSDTWVNSIDFLVGRQEETVYGAGPLNHPFCGSTMYFSRVGIQKITNWLKIKKNVIKYQILYHKLIDDQVFTHCIQSSVVTGYCAGNHTDKFVHCFDNELDTQFLDNAYSIDFKETSWNHGYDGQDTFRKLALKRIQTYADYKESL